MLLYVDILFLFYVHTKHHEATTLSIKLAIIHTCMYVNVTDECWSGLREALGEEDALILPLINHLHPGTLTARHTLQCTDGVRVGAGGRAG